MKSHNKIRLGIFVDGLVVPPFEGINVHLYQLGRSLHCYPELEVVFFIADRGWVTREQLLKEPFDSLLINPELYYQRYRIEDLIIKYKIDIIQTHSPPYTVEILGPISQKIRIPLFLEFHDVEEDIAESLGKDKDKVEYSKWIQLESAKYASKIRVMSKYDYKKFLCTYPEKIKKRMFWLPVSFNTDYVEYTGPNTRLNKILFLGNMSYEPNYNAAQRIIDVIAPSAKDNPIQFIVAGRGGLEWKTQVKNQSNIILLGPITNIKELASQCAIGISPIFEGSGMKIKLITYLAAGLPIITTKFGARGYPKSECILLEDDLDKYILKIKQLTQNSKKLIKLGKIAREVFEKYFDTEKNNKYLLKVYQKIEPIEILKKSLSISKEVKRPEWLNEKREVGKYQTNRHIFVKGIK